MTSIRAAPGLLRGDEAFGQDGQGGVVERRIGASSGSRSARVRSCCRSAERLEAEAGAVELREGHRTRQ